MTKQKKGDKIVKPQKKGERPRKRKRREPLEEKEKSS